MSTIIKTFIDNLGNIIIPRTRTDAITTRDGKLLDDALLYYDDSTPGDPLAVNADTLENHPASYFATAAALSALANSGVKIVSGTYVGDGTSPKTITIPFTPIMVVSISSAELSIKMAQGTFRQLMYQGSASAGSFNTSFKCVANGFEVGTGDGVTQAALHSDSNTTGVTYNYVAIG